jgi:hypothetical protein
MLSAAVECLPFDFCALDTAGRCVLQNALSRRYYGNALGKTAEDVCPEKRLLSRWLASTRRVLAGERVEDENRYGLEGIRERARVLGGRCSIKSKPGEGTVLLVELPVIELT